MFPYDKAFLYRDQNQAGVRKQLQEQWALHKAPALILAKVSVLNQTWIAASDGATCIK